MIMFLSVVLIAIASLASGSSVLYVGRKEAVTWYEARDNCVCWGGQLATFSNKQQYESMKKAVEEDFGRKAWIGMTGNDQGQWTFIDGETDFCNANTCGKIDEWYTNEPNNPGSEHCAELYHYGNNGDNGGYGRINNLPCNDKQYYLCEFNPDNYAFEFYHQDLSVPMPWIPEGRGPQPALFGTYSAQDLMVVALAVFGVINVVTLAVVCMRTKGAASIRYGKVMADSDA